MELPDWKVEERERGMIDLEEEVVHITMALALFSSVSLHCTGGAV